MPSFNNVTLVGNVTRDPELKFTPKGNAVANLGLAVNRKWKDDSGSERDEVSFIDCVAFGRQAETLGQYVRKGHPLLISGRLRQETWDDKSSGQKRSKLLVVVEQFQFLGGKQDGQSTRQVAPTAPPEPQPDSEPDGSPPDDVPF